MGVKDLWQLLAPIGRRVSIETLEGKVLAVDVSIWITQFIKAMRDEDGKVLKNAHLIGTLRRVLKLLFNRIKPVFVFDGSTPTLKLRTTRARKLVRDKQDVNYRKAAERLLMSQLRQQAIREKMLTENVNTDSSPFVETFIKPPNKISENPVSLQVKEKKSNIPIDKNNPLISPSIGSRIRMMRDNGDIQEGIVISENIPNQTENILNAKSEVQRFIEVLFEDDTCEEITVPRDDIELISDNSTQTSDTLLSTKSTVIPVSKQGINGKSSILPPILKTEDNGIDKNKKNFRRIQKIVSNSNQENNVLVEENKDVDEVINWESGYTDLPAPKPLGTGSDSDNSSSDGENDHNTARWMLPENVDELDLVSMASLPPHIRKEMVEDAIRRERQLKRQRYLPVAGDPLLYSQTQLANFLRTSKWKRKVEDVQKLVDLDSGVGKQIAAEGTRKYLLQTTSSSSSYVNNNGSINQKPLPMNPIKDDDDDDDDDDDNESWLQDSDVGKSDEGGDSKRTDNQHTTIVVDLEAEDEDCGGGGFLTDDLHTSSTVTKSIMASSTIRNSTTRNIPETGDYITAPRDSASDETVMATRASTTRSNVVDDNNSSSSSSSSSSNTIPIFDNNRNSSNNVSLDPLTSISVISESSNVRSMFLSSLQLPPSNSSFPSPTKPFLPSSSRPNPQLPAPSLDNIPSLQKPVDSIHENDKNNTVASMVLMNEGEDDLANVKWESGSEDNYNSDSEYDSYDSENSEDEDSDDKEIEMYKNTAETLMKEFAMLKESAALLTAPSPGSQAAGTWSSSSSQPDNYRNNSMSNSNSVSRGLEGNSNSQNPPSNVPSVESSHANDATAAALARAVTTASRMADWAGRAVEKAMKQHFSNQPSQTALGPQLTTALPTNQFDDSMGHFVQSGDWQEANNTRVDSNQSELVNTNTSTTTTISLSPILMKNAQLLHPTNPTTNKDLQSVSHHLPTMNNNLSSSSSNGAVKATQVVNNSENNRHCQNEEDLASHSTQNKQQNIHPISVEHRANDLVVVNSLSSSSSISNSSTSSSHPSGCFISDTTTTYSPTAAVVISSGENSAMSSNSVITVATAINITTADVNNISKPSTIPTVLLPNSINIVNSLNSSPVLPLPRTFNPPPPPTATTTTTATKMDVDIPPISTTNYHSMLQQEQQEESEAVRAKRRAMRDMEGMTDDLTEEVRELLDMLGLPYIIAPYEAEAQCAVLEQGYAMFLTFHINNNYIASLSFMLQLSRNSYRIRRKSIWLVDGVITEDSDAILFGAKSIYRNIFDDRKYVEVYLAEDAKLELGLSRSELVALAYLLGSDYTEGVRGVGIVNAMEIVHAFNMRSNNNSNSSCSSSNGKEEEEGVDHTHDDDDEMEGNQGIGNKVSDGKLEAGVLAGLEQFKNWLYGFNITDVQGMLSGKDTKKNNKNKRKKSNVNNNNSTENHNESKNKNPEEEEEVEVDQYEVDDNIDISNETEINSSIVTMSTSFTVTDDDTTAISTTSRRSKRKLTTTTTGTSSTVGKYMEESDTNDDIAASSSTGSDVDYEENDGGINPRTRRGVSHSKSMNRKKSTRERQKSTVDEVISDSEVEYVEIQKVSKKRKRSIAPATTTTSSNASDDVDTKFSSITATTMMTTGIVNKDDHNIFADRKVIFHERHKNVRPHWIVSENFPNPTVAHAYLHPPANRCEEAFSWNIPSLPTRTTSLTTTTSTTTTTGGNEGKCMELRDFLQDKLGWTDNEIDTKIIPVLKRFTESDFQHQRRIDSYFTTYHDNTRFAKIKSDRLKNTVIAITNSSSCSSSSDRNKPTAITTTLPSLSVPPSPPTATPTSLSSSSSSSNNNNNNNNSTTTITTTATNQLMLPNNNESIPATESTTTTRSTITTRKISRPKSPVITTGTPPPTTTTTNESASLSSLSQRRKAKNQNDTKNHSSIDSNRVTRSNNNNRNNNNNNNNIKNKEDIIILPTKRQSNVRKKAE